MGKTNNKILIILLLAIIAFAFILFVFLYKSKMGPYLNKFKNSVFFLEKDFTAYDNYTYSSLNKGAFRIIEGNDNLPWTTVALFKGVVDGLPFFDKNIKSYILPIRVPGKNKSVKANLVIGLYDQLIPVYLSKNGIIEDVLKWKTLSVESSLTYFKKNYPLIIHVYYQKDTKAIESLKNCNDVCKIRSKQYLEYTLNAEHIFNKINTKNYVNNGLYIGPLESIIIYVE